MAEFVQLRKEKWTDALAGLRQLQLLNQDEYRSVVQEIDAFEHKIQTPNRKLEDVLAYIQFECKLLKTLQHLRKVNNQYDLADEVDRFIFIEIRQQFGSGEITFKHKLDFWNARIKFIATVVPEQDRESEFNVIFKKALDFCGRSNFELYKYVVEFQWGFLNVATKVKGSKKNKKLRLDRRDCSRLMTSIREVTRDGIRNFSKSLEAHLWAILNEFKYLCILEEEKNAKELDPKMYLPFDVQEEVKKTERIIEIFCTNVLNKSQQFTHVPFQTHFQLYDTICRFSIPLADQLCERLKKDILLVRPQTSETYQWLLKKSIEESKIDECLERIRKTTSSETKRKILEISIDTLEILSSTIEIHPDYLSKLVQVYVDILTNTRTEASLSEKYYTSLIQFMKTIPKYIKLSSAGNFTSVITCLNEMSEKYPLGRLTKIAVTKFPNNFTLAKERILQILGKDELKTAVICKYLSEVNWKSVRNEEESRNFTRFIYYTILASGQKMKPFFLLNNMPGVDEIRTIHLKSLYLEEISVGREFYIEYRLLTSSWIFAYAAIQIETNICGTNGKYSDVLKTAIEDACRLSQTKTTESWKLCVRSHIRMKNHKEASQLLHRALSNFSSEKDSRLCKDLLLFSTKIKMEM